MSDTMVRRFCGDCAHHCDRRQICHLNLSYAAFVYPYSEAGDCPGYTDKERAAGEVAQQSQTRGGAVPYFGQYITGVKQP